MRGRRPRRPGGGGEARAHAGSGERGAATVRCAARGRPRRGAEVKGRIEPYSTRALGLTRIGAAPRTVDDPQIEVDLPLGDDDKPVDEIKEAHAMVESAQLYLGTARGHGPAAKALGHARGGALYEGQIKIAAHG